MNSNYTRVAQESKAWTSVGVALTVKVLYHLLQSHFNAFQSVFISPFK